MPDNIAITAGSGTNVATDEINDGSGLRHFQLNKVCWGAENAVNQTSASAPLPTQDIPSTSNGLTRYYLTSAATTNGNNVKSSAGKVYSITAYNSNASPRYLRLYNVSGAPTVGTTATFECHMIPAGGGLHLPFPTGVTFSTGIAVSLTTGAADTDTGAVAANEIKLNIGYV